MRIMTYHVTAADVGRAVRSVVPQRFALGEHAFRRLKVQGGILLNGQRVRADHRVSEGDLLEIRLESSDPVSSGSPPSLSGPPSFIRYQDEDLLIVSKGAPLATLPSAHIQTGTLREQLCAMLSLDPAAFSYHPVNRLDKGTSGLLCVARHAHAQRLLSLQLHTGAFVREYLAVVQGIPPLACGTIDAPIARLGSGALRGIRPDGQRAVTHYRLESSSNGRSLLRLRLETGRTHQIRVHLASIGCPIVGDYLYGSESPSLPGRFALHSAALHCIHPITGNPIDLQEPLPACLRDFMR